jgi:ribosomal protein S18 acetylase RimI-like enzyme
MLLEVRPSNTPALRLYERKGFMRVGLRRRYYPAHDGAREDAIVMIRRLDQWGPARG